MNLDNDVSLLTLNATNTELPFLADEETLVEDHRAGVRPAQRVEQRLVEAMKSGPLCISQLQTFKRPNSR